MRAQHGLLGPTGRRELRGCTDAIRRRHEETRVIDRIEGEP